MMLHGEVIRRLCIRLQSILQGNNGQVYKTYQPTPEYIDVRKNPNGRYIRLTAEGGQLVMRMLRTNFKAVLRLPDCTEDFSQFFYTVRNSIDWLCSQSKRG